MNNFLQETNSWKNFLQRLQAEMIIKLKSKSCRR
uniref:Uncharacterized protein n=1 Tax=Siphoviridae sp. ctedO8 TaxID=2827907 RepID=A0A8S5T2V3_9CAUD|nr:MAG TPA: hypothetical protein [Siphoviridae sp. ctedO8]